jgi:hypothetical protein
MGREGMSGTAVVLVVEGNGRPAGGGQIFAREAELPQAAGGPNGLVSNN